MPRCFLLFCTFLLIAVSCQNDTKTARSTSHFRFIDDTLVNYNRGIIKSEEQEIDDYIKRHGWELNRSSTGLRYVIYYPGDGERMTPGKKITLSYTVNLLNGSKVYSSDKSGPKEFIQGKTEVEPGLNELSLLLRKGDKVKAILPSHLAFGLLGDQNLIPPGAALVYDIEVIGVSPVKK